MPVLDNLEPKSVFHYFEELSAIPRPSRHTKAVSDWCLSFAQERELECYQDAASNLLIKAPASPGYEAAETVILQGHLDMVCEKAPGNPINMERDGLRTAISSAPTGPRSAATTVLPWQWRWPCWTIPRCPIPRWKCC